ncbi:MAG: ribonuclease HI [Peptococcaceae bacterium]|nr:ribonuclease HI [Peptococcaceae bacterium]
MKQVSIYTDGACSGNPGPGGWGAVLSYQGTQKELSGGEPMTTNNRMELMAAICALRALKEPCAVQLHSDSAYLVNAFNSRWLDNWRRNGWRTAKNDAVENQDLWLSLLELSQTHRIQWIKVKGHANDAINNRCDYLAVEAARAASGSGFERQVAYESKNQEENH